MPWVIAQWRCSSPKQTENIILLIQVFSMQGILCSCSEPGLNCTDLSIMIVVSAHAEQSD